MATAVGIGDFSLESQNSCASSFLQSYTISSHSLRCHFTSGQLLFLCVLLPLLLPRYNPPLVKLCLSCQYSSGPRAPLFIGPPTALPRAPPLLLPRPASFSKALFCSKGKQTKKQMRLRGKEEGGIEWNEIDGQRKKEKNNGLFPLSAFFQPLFPVRQVPTRSLHGHLPLILLGLFAFSSERLSRRNGEQLERQRWKRLGGRGCAQVSSEASLLYNVVGVSLPTLNASH